VSVAADRDWLRAQLAGHLERLNDEEVWGLEIPGPPAASPLIGEPNPATLTNPVAEVPAAIAPEVSSEKRAGSCDPSGFRDKSFPEVAAEALQCVACGLHETRTKVVFGIGNPDARLMFIGEGPGRDEDLQGEPFVGRAGRLLTKIIQAMGYQREDVYIANAVKCRPPQNRDPKTGEIEACRHFLMDQVALIQPDVIVLLGRSAVGAVLGLSAPLSKLRGTFRDWNGTKVMCTYHPAYLLRNPSAKGMVWEDMQLVRDKLAATTEN
jgi:DNA polymerase